MIKNLLQEGFALKSRGHYKHAIEVFYKALEEDCNSSELLLEIADLYYKMQNEERSLNYIEQILAKNPGHVEALKLLEKIFVIKRAYPQAEQTAKNIYCISHKNGDLAQIFRLLNLQKKYDEIFEYNVPEPSVEIYLEQARAMYGKKNFVKSREFLEKAAAESPDNPDILLLLGQVYYASGQKDLCIQLLEKLPDDNNNAELLNFQGLIEDYKGNYKKACACLYKASKLKPDNDRYHYNLANIYFKQGDALYAKQHYNFALSLNPESENYHFALANLYYSEKHYKKALEELPENLFEAKLLKVIILYDTGYLALAKQVLNSLFAECPDNSILQEYSGRIDRELRLK